MGGTVDGTVLVFAAASLTDAFTELADRFEAAHPGVDVELNLAGSANLREQILDGAPADVVATANPSTMAGIDEAGLLATEPVVFARNRLVLAVPVDNPGGVLTLADLADPDLLVGLCAEGVPCGDLARQALDGEGITPSIDTAEPDVRALVARLAAGELDAGIVYVTDVAASDGALVALEAPVLDAAVAEYPIAVVSDGPNPAAADALVDFVLGDQGRLLLDAFGFSAS